jgi:hypothetical protein
MAKVDESPLLHDVSMKRFVCSLATLATLTSCGGGSDSTTPTEWRPPACAAISGTSAIAFSTNEGTTLVPRLQTPTSGSRERISGLIAMPAVADRMLAVRSTGNGQVGAEVLVSRDAGCSWSSGSLRLQGIAEFVTTEHDVAYGWANLTQGNYFYAMRPDGSGREELLEHQTDALTVSATDPNIVYRVETFGRVMRSPDGGRRWTVEGQFPQGNFIAGIGAAAFSPGSVSHIVVGTELGAFVSQDGGTTWVQSNGVSAPSGQANVTRVAFSSANASVVWASGLDITENNANPPKGHRLWRSTDGGLTFTTVFDRSDAGFPVTFGNLIPHPTNINIVYWHIEDPAFSVVALYKFDITTGLVTAIAPPGIDGIQSMAFHPTNPMYIYFGLYWRG